jgi:aryl-alcohol dehydrogenase-like predicted oxidoreductase
MEQKIILGTANFTGEYGFVNTKRLNPEEISQIITHAQINGVNHFDTARAYGNAEEILGNKLDKSQSITIDSKINKNDCVSVDMIVRSAKETIEKVGLTEISTLYLHNFELIAEDKQNIVKNGLERVLELELAKHIGISVYTKSELINAKKMYPLLTHFQIIENICDRRLIESSEIMEIAESENVINVRSIFLQGILLSEPNKLPNNFKSALAAINATHQYADSQKVSILDLCLAYAKSIKWASKIVVGIDSKKQLEEILKSNYELDMGWQNEIPVIPTSLMDPRFW